MKAVIFMYSGDQQRKYETPAKALVTFACFDNKGHFKCLVFVFNSSFDQCFPKDQVQKPHESSQILSAPKTMNIGLLRLE
jgi:hypothetical protein